MDFVSGIESVLAERSASLLLRLVRDLDEEAAVYEEWWRGRMIAGAILADFREDDSRVPALRGLGLPAVAVGHPSLTGPFPAVRTDDASAVAEAVRYLAALGHRRIARVGGPTDLGAQRHPGARLRRHDPGAGPGGSAADRDRLRREGGRPRHPYAAARRREDAPPPGGEPRGVEAGGHVQVLDTGAVAAP
jgi:hypothetical protein